MAVDEARLEPTDVGCWDPALTRHVVGLLRPLVKLYHRSEVRGLDNLPDRACLLVCNHSGGMTTPDFAVFAVDYFDRYGYDRPLYTLAHDLLFQPPAVDFLKHLGVVHASPENAAAALATGAVVLVFPGGDLDVYRPTVREVVVDFGGRTGYVDTAMAAGVPIVPMVSIGGQETQLFLSRGRRLARVLGLSGLERRLGRTDILPISVGFPFGLSVLIPVNMPLPAKIVTEVLEPIDVITRFGDRPDVQEVDAYVRGVMEAALHRLARKRRFPILG
ncbi:MAG TPA: 1-acyl-sn-glycerol-3-phosphate acyltransferase [Mycobacterium sp.]|nr:1-acyl-sn-glycerol-3-phosphate acyltransferase [Mycobacterium sp.]